MNGDKNVYAHFSRAKYELRIHVIPSGSGETDPIPSGAKEFYDYNSIAMVTARPINGYRFLR